MTSLLLLLSILKTDFRNGVLWLDVTAKASFSITTLNYDVTVLFLAPRSEIILLSAGESFYHDLKESRMQLACFVRKLLKYLENQVKSSNFQLEKCRHVQKNLM